MKPSVISPESELSTPNLLCGIQLVKVWLLLPYGYHYRMVNRYRMVTATVWLPLPYGYRYHMVTTTVWLPLPYGYRYFDLQGTFTI